MLDLQQDLIVTKVGTTSR